MEDTLEQTSSRLTLDPFSDRLPLTMQTTVQTPKTGTLEEFLAGTRTYASNKDKGDDFERWTAWALKRHPAYGVKKIMRYVDYAGEIDTGIDKVVWTNNGEKWAVQDKNVAPDDSITKRELDSFLNAAAAGDFDRAFLIALTDNVARNARKVIEEHDKKGKLRVTLILRHNLEQFPFTGGPSDPKPKKRPKPRPDQVEVVNANVEAYKTYDRITNPLACGYGKTFTTQWTWEKVAPAGPTFFAFRPLLCSTRPYSSGHCTSTAPISSFAPIRPLAGVPSHCWTTSVARSQRTPMRRLTSCARILTGLYSAHTHHCP